MKITTQDRFRGCLLGLAAGDAVGTAVEFMPRGSFEPVTDMLGGGPFRLKPGQWTDDTSMALCLAESLIGKQGFDARDQMERYVRWYRDGYLSCTGKCFDIGNATSDALLRFERTGEPIAGSTDPRSAGNGSLMRLAPVPMFCYPDAEKAVHYAGESSRTTHGAAECIDACKLYAYMLVKALDGKSKDEILLNGGARTPDLCPKIKAIAAGEYRNKPESQIQGSGYVVESLEAEEDRSPECVERPLHQIKAQSPPLHLPSPAQPDQPGGHRHHRIKGSPYRSEQPTGRIPRRLGQFRVPPTGLDEDAGGRSTERQPQPAHQPRCLPDCRVICSLIHHPTRNRAATSS